MGVLAWSAFLDGQCVHAHAWIYEGYFVLCACIGECLFVHVCGCLLVNVYHICLSNAC